MPAIVPVRQCWWDRIKRQFSAPQREAGLVQWLQLVVKVGLMLPTGNHTQENYSEVKKGMLASHLNISFFISVHSDVFHLDTLG